jgi:predicted AlkP superfamily phosphohydrolase/phosphomutase
MRRRIIVLGLDGYEPSVAQQLLADGRMPNLQALARDCMQCRLDHGEAKRTGLAWEHVALGREPAAYDRFAAVDFDPGTYRVTQTGTKSRPFLADINRRSIVFDAPYFDLAAAPNCLGLVSWGAHDAGIARTCAPPGLAEEIAAKFGPYPAKKYIYGFVWQNEEHTRAMAAALVEAIERRSAIGQWLCAERMRDWDLALIVVSEFHSALEALWHGYDPAHPLHHLPSATAAHAGIVGVYEAFDRMLGRYRTSMPEADLVLFSMHGMGANDSDVPTMLLLPELLYRASFGSALFESRPEWTAAPDAIPILSPDETWDTAVKSSLRHRRRPNGERLPLDWMPATVYRRYWPEMEAFALPSYYDGRLRINLAGRERNGLVPVAAYDAKLDAICALLAECRDPRTNQPVVRAVKRPVAADPLKAGPTEADLVIIWQGAPLAFRHERLGLIGPAPYRRTGGHTGAAGIAYFTAPELPRGEIGTVSAFDVVPTLIDLLGAPRPSYVSGHSLLHRPASLTAA